MSRPAKHTKGQMAARMEPVFRDYGFEGASLSMLATAAELSKASLYHHYPRGKADMASSVLAQSGARLQKLVLGPLTDKNAGTGAERLKASFAGVATYYAGDVPVCLMNSLLLGEGRSLFAAQIDSAVTAWHKGVAYCLEEDGANRQDATEWAVEAIARMQGALVLCRVQSRRDPLDRMLEALEAEVADWHGGS